MNIISANHQHVTVDSLAMSKITPYLLPGTLHLPSAILHESLDIVHNACKKSFGKIFPMVSIRRSDRAPPLSPAAISVAIHCTATKNNPVAQKAFSP